MGALTTALPKIVEFLTGKLPADVEVKEHPGRFTEDELGRILTKRKAVRVAIESLPKLDVSGDGIQSVEVQFNAFVICADLKGEDRHTAALEIVEQLVGLVAYTRWDNAAFGPVVPKAIAVANLYSGDLSNGKGIAWWSVSWSQTIRNT